MEPPWLLLVVLFPATGAIGVWVLRPVERAAKARSARVQFTIVDFLCLFLLIQLPMALIGWAVRPAEGGLPWELFVMGSICCGLLWWMGVRTLCRAGITHTWHRAAFLVLVVPVTIAGAIFVPPLTLMLLTAILVDQFPRQQWHLARAVAVEITLLAGFLFCGLYTRWMVAAAAGPRGDRASATRSEQDRTP